MGAERSDLLRLTVAVAGWSRSHRGQRLDRWRIDVTFAEDSETVDPNNSILSRIAIASQTAVSIKYLRSTTAITSQTAIIVADQV